MPNLTSHKAFFILLVLYLLFFMHIVLPNPGGGGLYLVSNSIGWVFISCLIALGLWQATMNKVLIFSKFHLLILVALTLISIPLFYGQPFSHFAIPRILALLSGFTLLISLSQLQFNSKNKELLLLILLGGVFVESLIGLIQLYVLMPFDIQILTYTPVFNRPYGSFIQPNVMASFLATGTALSLFLLTVEKKHHLSNKIEAFKYICLFLFTLLITVLQSKTGYIATALVLLCFAVKFINNKIFGQKVLGILTLSIIIGYVTLQTDIISDRGDKLYQDQSRSDIYKVTGQMFIDKPISGVGYGNFERSYRDFHLQQMQDDSSLSSPLDELRHPHNEILFWAVEGGIIALIAITIFCFSYAYLFKGMKSRTIFPLVALILPICFHSQTEFPLYQSVAHWFYFIIFIWYTEQIIKTEFKSTSISNSVNNFIKIFTLIYLIAVFCFMLTTIHTSIKFEQFKKSGSQDISHMSSIINRLAWQEQVEVTLYNYHLKKGFNTRDTNALLEYIRWGSEFVKHTPRKDLYQNMILSIDTLSANDVQINSELKTQIYNDAIRLYPSFTETNEK